MTNHIETTKSKITLISLHGLIRAQEPELGCNADTGGQVKYVLDLARELARHPEVREVELLTRQIIDDRVSPDYAQLEEPIAENARIVRLPFGPKRYIRKEALWPYIEVFIDQALGHFKRHGLPDIIHGHYADAGMAGAQLARLLHIPYIFTGHSLGRVKRQRLSIGKADPRKLEKKYHFTTRIEAEEIALETAAMVVTSTNQEVEEQYSAYEHYVPDRMEVIPPGVDLSAFQSESDPERQATIAEEVNRFLRDPNKPIILTMARPDERKNLGKLVQVFGESERLRELANLVLIMGIRDDLRELPAPQRRIVQEILTLVDVYDLHGQVAYPKSHQPSDVPDLYRMAKQSRGVFINPALTEPFGLTLLEAAATGVPIVATNDGGPRDIVANCRNGLLVDPLNSAVIERALLRTLTEPDQWDEWSHNGIVGAREHYRWSHHVDRYLRDLNDILENSPPPVLSVSFPHRRIPSFDRLIITDLDNTLTGDSEALEEFAEILRNSEHIGFGIATGRTLQSALEMVSELNLPIPDLLDTSVGTELYYGEDLTPDYSWRKQIDYHWQPEEIRNVLDNIEGLFPQEEEKQSKFKISYEYDSEVAPRERRIHRLLREAGLQANVITSLGMFLDVIPVRGGSENSMRHLLYRWGFPPEHVLVAGDSGNDAGMLKGRTLGVVVGNHSPEMDKLRKWPRIYFAQAHHARGIIEGIHYYQFLSDIVIPNDSGE